MSLTEKQQMQLDTESATHTGMEGQSRCSHKYLLLQVWCGLLTVALVVMGAFLTSIKTKSTEDQVSTLKPDNVSPTVSSVVASLQATGSSFSYIQLIKSSHNDSWQDSHPCASCSLVLRNDAIHCKKDSIYFIYAQVAFRKEENPDKSVTLISKDLITNTEKNLVGGAFPKTTGCSVWVAKVVSLKNGESVRLNIEGDILNENTFWGAFQLH